MSALSIVPEDTVASSPAQKLVRAAFTRLQQGFRAERYPSALVRMDRLFRLERMLQRNTDALLNAIDADFRGRSRVESLYADIHNPIDAIRHARKHLQAWMRPVHVAPDWYFLPSTARVECQPKGVIAVLSPWNYPVNLAIVPLAEALAAGNRVLLKPSEMTPRTADLLAQLLCATFAADEVQTITGGVDVARAVTELPWDHLVFTGSTRVGREVAQAIADNLVPATLELGGKSPVIVARGYDIVRVAERVAFGKLFNGGQTCIAPDYVLLPAGSEDAFVDAFQAFVGKTYGDLQKSPDYTAIVSQGQRERLENALDAAARQGARVIRVDPLGTLATHQPKMAPALVLNPPLDSHLMRDELFGPVLPIVTYRTLDEAIGLVNERPRPLALYVFSNDDNCTSDVLRRTCSGGACVNDTMTHFAQHRLPFGGVGPSGMGAYHGHDGFLTFSHKKSVFSASRLSALGWFKPPYPALVQTALRKLAGVTARR